MSPKHHLHPMRVTLAVLTLLALGGRPPEARANCGPVAWTGTTPTAGIVPVEVKDIRLVSEDLRIALDDDGRHYSVDAKYILSNPGGPRKLQLGFPILKFSDDMSGARPLTPFEGTISDAAIEIGGERLSCVVTSESVEPPVAIASSNEWFLSKHREFSDDENYVVRWCVASATVPVGDSIELRLRYKTEFIYMDESCSTDVFARYSVRYIRYALFPAGYWQGPAKEVRIEINPGRFAGLLEVKSPTPFKALGDAFVWTGQDVDLKTMPDLVANLNADPVYVHRDFSTYKFNGQDNGELGHFDPMTVKASSTLASQGDSSYRPENLIDSNPATACCEGAEGDGKGEWIELRFGSKLRNKYESREPWRLFFITLGYAKDEVTYLDNGTLNWFKLSSCSDPSKYIGVDASPSKIFDRSTMLIKMDGSYTDDGVDGEFCVRLTILGMTPGRKHHDTCISAFGTVAKGG